VPGMSISYLSWERWHGRGLGFDFTQHRCSCNHFAPPAPRKLGSKGFGKNPPSTIILPLNNIEGVSVILLI
jgi:hypothetical protein